ncbi:hypothetical protein L6Q79_06990 [bacterium]|nr:hypothetical protein [bacterium]NUN44693.1 hypothetical protein [bacterium]
MNIVELDNIVLYLDKQVLGKEPNISLKDLKSKDIPSFYKNYFDREAEKWIREESSMFLSSGRFNYDDPEVRAKFEELYMILKNKAIFNRSKLHRNMEQAVKLQSNFLIAPQRTMVQFIYRDDETLTPAEVKDSMKYFLDYDYYYKALETYFATNAMETISRAKFKNFIAQLDEKALSQDKTVAAVNVAKVIVGFLNMGRTQQSDVLESDILVNAYQDRSLPEYVEAIKQAISKGKTTLAVSVLDTMFKSYLSTGDIEPKVEVKPTKVEVTKYDDKTDIINTKNLNNLVSQIEDIAEEPVMADVDALFEEDDDDIVLTPQPEVKPIKAEAPKPVETPKAEVHTPSSGGHASVSDQFADQLAKNMGQADVLEDLNKIIEDKDKKTYIKKLFKKKDKEFFDLIATLNAAKNWKDANNIIDDEFYRLEINPYQSEAIAFTDAVYSRYFPKS